MRYVSIAKDWMTHSDMASLTNLFTHSRKPLGDLTITVNNASPVNSTDWGPNKTTDTLQTPYIEIYRINSNITVKFFLTVSADNKSKVAYGNKTSSKQNH